MNGTECVTERGWSEETGTGTLYLTKMPVDPQSWTPDKIMTIIYLTLGSIGLLGNSFVVLVIFTHTAMKKQLTNLFIINQSLIDAASSLVVLLTSILADRGREMHGTSGMLLCRFWYSMFFLWSPLVSSTFNLLAITMERYLCIVHPIMYKIKVTKKTVLVSCLAVWAIGFFIEVFISILPAGVDENMRCNVHYFWPSEAVQKGAGVACIFIAFILPLLTMVYCYVRIARALQLRIVPTSSHATGADNKLARARRNVIKTLAIVAACFVVCWLPNQCIFLIFNLGSPISFTTWYYHLSIVMVYMNCCCNPFIYIAQYKQFQIGVRKLKGRLFNRTQITSNQVELNAVSTKVPIVTI